MGAHLVEIDVLDRVVRTGCVGALAVVVSGCCSELGALLEDLDADEGVDDEGCEDGDPDWCVVGVDTDGSPVVVDPAPELCCLLAMLK